jgi:cold-inducible RNA-binding protein
VDPARQAKKPRQGEEAISAKVFVGNMSFKTTKEELTELLSQVGTIVDVHIPTDRESGRPRGFAFVRFSTDDEAAEAIKRFNGFEFAGRRLNINQAEDRPRRTDGAGPPPRREGGPPRDAGGGRDRPMDDARPPRSFAAPPPPEPPDPVRDDFEYRRSPDEEDDSGGRPRPKGSRRGLRARKRSL